MARSRLDLHKELCELLGSDAVFFQPPESLLLTYPCIVYHRTSPSVKFADNKTYSYTDHYDVTYITEDPDDEMIRAITDHFSMCRLSRPFTADNLNHYLYSLYY